jgi:hypothetical protein
MPALGLMIERLGVQDAALFANLGRAASRLTNSGRATAMAPALRRWQAGLGLLEEVQRLRRLSPDAVGTLLASFGKTAPEDVGQPDGKVGNWLLHDLLPALGLVAGEPQTLESVAVRAFVGTAPPDLTLTWESLPYVLDWRGPVERDALAIRRAHPGLTLTDLAALDDFRRRLESPTSSIDEAHAIGKGLSAFQPRLALLPLASGKRPPIIDELRDSARRLTQLEAKDLAKARGELPHVLEAIDQVSSVVIPGLLYALAASPTEQPPATYADMWSHHLNVVDNETQPDTVKFGTSWRVTAWQVPIPVVRAGGGAGLQGAFLGVDVALADARLVAVGAPASDEPAQVEDRDRAGLVSMLALHSPPLIAARAADGVANAIASGRAMVAQWLTAHARRDVIRSGLRAAGVSEWRVNLFLWKFDHAEDVTEALTMADLYALGTDNELPVAFGGASMPIDGCVCQVVRTRRAPEVLLGYWGAGLDGASFVDLTLRLIEHLSALKLPAGLATVLLPAAIQDLLDHVHQYSPNDWDALASWARRLPQERVEQYLLALVSNGTLVPPGGGGH